jgi:hypothetical protein
MHNTFTKTHVNIIHSVDKSYTTDAEILKIYLEYFESINEVGVFSTILEIYRKTKNIILVTELCEQYIQGTIIFDLHSHDLFDTFYEFHHKDAFFYKNRTKSVSGTHSSSSNNPNSSYNRKSSNSSSNFNSTSKPSINTSSTYKSSSNTSSNYKPSNNTSSTSNSSSNTSSTYEVPDEENSGKKQLSYEDKVDILATFNIKYANVNEGFSYLLKNLKRLYHLQALKLHPDKGGNEDKFKKLSNYYELLQDM